MTVYSFILAFIRFTNNVGVPSHLYSNNAKTFTTGGRIIQQAYGSEEYNSIFLTYSVKHLTIPVYAAWFGSTWERLIRTVKTCLFKMVGRSQVSYFQLLTFVSDIQRAVNNRPLTYRCSSDDGLEIITPNHFLRPFSAVNILYRKEEEDLFDSEPPSGLMFLRLWRRGNNSFPNTKSYGLMNTCLALENRRKTYTMSPIIIR